MNGKITRKIEEQITRKLIRTAAANGWPCIGYDYGDGFQRDTDHESIVSMCLNVDDLYLIFASPDKPRRSWVRLVYGNDGWDLINDYSLTPGFEESVMNPMNEYTENIEKHLFT